VFEIILFFFLFIDSVQQIARYYRKGVCPVWVKHTSLARIHYNITEIFS